MNIKKIFNNLTKYRNNYNFSIINGKIDTTSNLPEKIQKIFLNINENLEYLESKYNTLINSDIKIREFNMFANNKNHKCFIIYIDGLVDTNSINKFILEPLMSGKLKFNKPVEDNLSEYANNCLLPQNNVKKVSFKLI